jgi:hypothetical protein
VFWPTLRDNMLESKVSLDATLASLTNSAKLLSQVARRLEERKHDAV